MQLTIYLSDQDKELLERLDIKADSERKSRSQMILTIVERYFAGHERVGEILVEMGKLSATDVQAALKIQAKKDEHRLLGEILVQEGYASARDVSRALAIQIKDSE